MNEWPLLLLALAVLGSFAGFLAGLLGVGGALVMIPFLTYLLHHLDMGTDMAVKMAIATGMSTIVVTSLASTQAHHKAGSVRWDLFKGLTPGLVLGSVVSSLWLFSIIKGTVLALLFGGFTAFSATQMLLDKKPKPSRHMPGVFGQSAVGSVIGLVSGLVGAGGAFMSVPFMTWCNVKIHNAVATSSALGFPIALAGSLGYLLAGWDLPQMPHGAIGYLFWPGLLAISAASVPLPEAVGPSTQSTGICCTGVRTTEKRVSK